MRMCVAWLLDREKAWPQVVQAKGRSPECVRVCVVRVPEDRKSVV